MSRLIQTEEERQEEGSVLEARIAQNEQDLDQCDEKVGRYNREYLYNVRDLEKLLTLTECPLSAQELEEFGVSLTQKSEKYLRREQFCMKRDQEMRIDSVNVELHKAENPWKVEKISEEDDSEESKKKRLIRDVRSLLNKITRTTFPSLHKQFLEYEVHKSSALDEVVSIILELTSRQPKFCEMFAILCYSQKRELKSGDENIYIRFCNAFFGQLQSRFSMKNIDGFLEEKQTEIDAETEENKKNKLRIALTKAKSEFRRRKFGSVEFIGHLYKWGIGVNRIMHFITTDLLESVTAKSEGCKVDDESVEYAVRLLVTCGKQLQGVKIESGPFEGSIFPLDLCMERIEYAKSLVSTRVRFMILNLEELRANDWVPEKIVDDGPKKIEKREKARKTEEWKEANALRFKCRKALPYGKGLANWTG